MPLIYAFVAREDGAILADYTTYSGNFAAVAAECLQSQQLRETGADNKFTITCDGYTFNFLHSQPFFFLVVADDAFGRSVPYAFLARVKEEFLAGYADKGRTAPAQSMDRVYGPRLKYHLEYCQANIEEVNKLAAVQARVDEVKGVMVENIEKVLQRGERIELLVDKTDDLRCQAEKFKKQGRQLRNKMWWANTKMKVLFGFIILLVIIAIFLLACFAGGRNCVRKG